MVRERRDPPGRTIVLASHLVEPRRLLVGRDVLDAREREDVVERGGSLLLSGWWPEVRRNVVAVERLFVAPTPARELLAIGTRCVGNFDVLPFRNVYLRVVGEGAQVEELAEADIAALVVLCLELRSVECV